MDNSLAVKKTTIYRSVCMPHISRHVPEKKVAEEISATLLKHLTTKGSVRDRELLFSELDGELEASVQDPGLQPYLFI